MPNWPGAGQHAAAVDPHRKAEGLAVFERHASRGQLGAAVERNRRARWRTSTPCRRAETPARQGPRRRPARTRRPPGRSGSAAKRRDGIDAAAAEQQQPGAVRLGSTPACSPAPARLCSNSWRLLNAAREPASTLGLAAASITQSAGGQALRSRWPGACRRGSTSLPACRSRARLHLRPRAHQVVHARDGRGPRAAPAGHRPARCRRIRRSPVIRILMQTALSAR